MNKKLPFEEALERQLQSTSPADEDESWQKMKALLDANDKRRPMAFFKKYTVFDALLLLLLCSCLFVMQHNYRLKEHKIAASKQSESSKPLVISPKAPKQTLNKTQNTKPATSKMVVVSPKKGNILNSQSSATATKEKLLLAHKNRLTIKRKSDVAQQAKLKDNPVLISSPSGKQLLIKEKDEKTNRPDTNAKTDHQDTTLEAIIAKENSLSTDSISLNGVKEKQLLQLSDSLKDLAKKISAEPQANEKKSTNQQKKYTVVVGIGVQQQVPLAGQKVVHYGYKASSPLSDYIPSIYFRLQKEQKWFIQGEFSYGNPQLVKEFPYSRQTVFNSTDEYTVTTLRLKKTFYNQVPLSFNYYFRPGWSAGIGGMYSWFHGAISEKEIVRKNLLTQTNSFVKEILPTAKYTDSFLYNAHTYLLLQTDYHWKRLSLGVRYARDMQPYIKYTLPDGTVTEQKNWSLEFILRFSLWRSSRF